MLFEEKNAGTKKDGIFEEKTQILNREVLIFYSSPRLISVLYFILFFIFFLITH